MPLYYNIQKESLEKYVVKRHEDSVVQNYDFAYREIHREDDRNIFVNPFHHFRFVISTRIVQIIAYSNVTPLHHNIKKETLEKNM